MGADRSVHAIVRHLIQITLRTRVMQITLSFEIPGYCDCSKTYY